MTFLKIGKISYSDIRVKIDIAMILSSQAQIFSFKIARATHQLCSWRKLLNNCCYGRFSVVLIEVTNTLVKVHIYLSVYLCINLSIYLSMYLHICIYIYIHLYLYLSFYLSPLTKKQPRSKRELNKKNNQKQPRFNREKPRKIH